MDVALAAALAAVITVPTAWGPDMQPNSQGVAAKQAQSQILLGPLSGQRRTGNRRQASMSAFDSYRDAQDKIDDLTEQVRRDMTDRYQIQF